MQENSKKPAIRFDGFTDAWEQREFKQTFDLLTNNTFSRAELNNEKGSVRNIHYGDILVKFGEIIDLREDDLPYITGETNSPKTDLLQDGDIIIADTAEDSTVGKCAEVMGISDANVVSGLHTIPCRPRKRYAQGYLGYFMNSSAYHDQLLPLMQGTKVTSVSKSALQDTILCSPTDIREQALIGDFFRSLDNLITLHQRKYAKLVNIKKSMLEKMFPKDGEIVPEIRFAGFTDAWEQRKVGDLIEDYVEKTVVQNQYPVLTSSQQQGVVLQEDYFADRQVTTNDNIGYYVLPRGYFTYRSRSDTDLFVFNRNNIIDRGIISYYYPVFCPKDCDSDFLLRRLNHGMKHQLSMAAEGTGQRVLAHSKFKKMVLSIPDISEQKEIGHLFEALDNLITLHQRKLERLQNIKKSCLEKMFV